MPFSFASSRGERRRTHANNDQDFSFFKTSYSFVSFFRHDHRTRIRLWKGPFSQIEKQLFSEENADMRQGHNVCNLLSTSSRSQHKCQQPTFVKKALLRTKPKRPLSASVTGEATTTNVKTCHASVHLMGFRHLSDLSPLAKKTLFLKPH